MQGKNSEQVMPRVSFKIILTSEHTEFFDCFSFWKYRVIMMIKKITHPRDVRGRIHCMNIGHFGRFPKLFVFLAKLQLNSMKSLHLGVFGTGKKV